MKMNRAKTWVYGIRVIPKEKNFVLEGLQTILPIETGANKSSQYEKCYIWLWFYFNKIRTCDRCGKPSCAKGLIRYMNSDRSRVLVYVCKDCGKTISEIKEKSRKYCYKCEKRCLLNGEKCSPDYRETQIQAQTRIFKYVKNKNGRIYPGDEKQPAFVDNEGTESYIIYESPEKQNGLTYRERDLKELAEHPHPDEENYPKKKRRRRKRK